MDYINLQYQKSALGNVGDDLNPWLLARLLPDVRFGDSERVLLCIGSILVAERWDDYARKVVLGSGAKSLSRLPVLDDSWDVRFVRGPLTGAALGVPWITDPALLLGRFVPSPATRKGIGIIPYYRSNHRVWAQIADDCGARLLSPRMPLESFIEELNKCEAVFCEAMHGSIFADAMRIPWRPVTFQNAGFEGTTHAFKWSDWTGSVALQFDPLVQPLASMRKGPPFNMFSNFVINREVRNAKSQMIDEIRQAQRDNRFMLSADTVFNDRCDRLSQTFAGMNDELTNSGVLVREKPADEVK